MCSVRNFGSLLAGRSVLMMYNPPILFTNLVPEAEVLAYSKERTLKKRLFMCLR